MSGENGCLQWKELAEQLYESLMSLVRRSKNADFAGLVAHLHVVASIR